MADIIPWRKPSPPRPADTRTAAYLSDFTLSEGSRDIRRQHRAILGAGYAPSTEITFYIDSGLATVAQIGTAMKRLLIEAEEGRVSCLLVERTACLAPTLMGTIWVVQRLLTCSVDIIEAQGGQVRLDSGLRKIIDSWPRDLFEER